MKISLVRFRNGKYGVERWRFLPFGDPVFLSSDLSEFSSPSNIKEYCMFGTEEEALQIIENHPTAKIHNPRSVEYRVSIRLSDEET